MSDERLKPCPFCGSQLEMLINNPWLLYQHPENDCLLSKLVVRGTNIEKWNTRKPMERIVKKLEKQIYLNSYEPVNLGWNKAVLKAIKIVKAGGVDE